MPKERLSASGHADTRPIGDPTGEAGQRQNRRIEIVLWPNPPPQPSTAASAEDGAPQ